MPAASALESLPMTMGYFRLILRCFGTSPEARTAILAGTGVRPSDLSNASAEISLFQQVRQVENLNAICGPAWALTQPDLWSPTAHGAVGVAVLSAPTLADGLAVLSRYAHVRAPFFKVRSQRQKNAMRLDYELTVALDEPQWRPMMEIAFIAIRALCAAVLGTEPRGVQFRFACPRPAHTQRLKAVLGDNVGFGARVSSVAIPVAWTAIPSAFADASLFKGAVTELESALERLENPMDLLARVERLLRTMPDGRLSARDVARAVGVSGRTLTRRLQSANAQFRDLLDGELKARAARLLATSDLSRSDMAERLGYRDPTSFSRACRRWFPERMR